MILQFIILQLPSYSTDKCTGPQLHFFQGRGVYLKCLIFRQLQNLEELKEGWCYRYRLGFRRSRLFIILLAFSELRSNKLITATECNRKEIDHPVVRDNNISCVWQPPESCKVLNSFNKTNFNSFQRNLSKQTLLTTIGCLLICHLFRIENSVYITVTQGI